MSTYMFAPSPSFGISEHPFVTWRNAFDADEIKRITEYGDALPKDKATVGGTTEENDTKEIRESNLSWIDCNPDTQWIYDRLAYLCRQLNGQFYRFNLFGFSEHMQYTVYESDTQGHYTWHQDSGVNLDGLAPRKLSMVLQLSDPSEYEGGDLEILSSSTPTQVNRELGLLAAFPSYQLHRVTEVTKGIRKSLVVWVTGPAFV